METTFETRTDSGLNHLSPGDIWATRERGVFVVLSSRAAHWRVVDEEDEEDVYGHITTWHTCRPATDPEIARWNRAVAASDAKRAVRKALSVGDTWAFDGRQLVPPAMHRLDSYDDRWEPPVPVDLSPEQIAAEREYAAARADLTVTL